MESLIQEFNVRMDNFESILHDTLTSPKCETQPTTNVQLHSLSAMFFEFKQFVKFEINNLKEKIEYQDMKQNDLEQYMRRNCLLIHGIKREAREDCVTIALNVFSRMGVEIHFSHIDRAHRLAGKESNGKSKPIIVKFCSYFHKNLVYSHKKKLKSSGIYISESLTQSNFQIFNEAKRVFSRENVWTRDGRIMVKVGDRKHSFSSMKQLKDFQNPSSSAPESPLLLSSMFPSLPAPIHSKDVGAALTSSSSQIQPSTPIVHSPGSDTSTFMTPVNNVQPESASLGGSSSKKKKKKSNTKKRHAQRF